VNGLEKRIPLTKRLAEAEVAYHELVVGTSARVFVDQSGERIEYTPANAPRLAAYIADLKRQLGTSSLGPMRFWF
jgi:hypothetical protein